MPPTALLYDPETKTWLQFDTPLQVYTTTAVAEVRELLEKVEAQVEQQSLHAIGFVSYEASKAFEPTAETLSTDDFPLLWFGLFAAPRKVAAPIADSESPALNWRPELTEAEFAHAVARIKEAIAAGETYQVNFTFPLITPYTEDPWPLFCRLVNNQPDSYATWLDTGRFTICSVSPELFFEQRGKRLLSKPMKGTSARGMTQDDDRNKADALQASNKERAENIMVLDMIRNDLARLSGDPVQVENLCAIEKHPTVWQMTSTASTITDAPLADIFATLFPCASITGAPKLRTMHQIAALETVPRRIYTGAIGHIAPNRQSRFSVAIRTALIDREMQTATYGIGAGITWDSNASAEYRECLAKAQILEQTRPDFALLETLLWEPETGYFLLEKHLQRLHGSAIYFDYPYDRHATIDELQAVTQGLPPTPHKVRLLLEQSGAISLEATSIMLPEQSGVLRLRLAKKPVVINNPFLYHKTTARSVYAAARQAVADCDEVLLYNDKGEVTEACNYNLVAKLDGELITPPIACGLLAGTLRAHLLTIGKIREQIILIDDLPLCEELFLINSVRRWQSAKLAL